jgi:pyruvate dehydrogenase E2 component (dihydrolipoamide acetyltransferase)
MLGLTMEEGAVAEWLKQEGERVAKDEPLFTVEMDKGIVEVPAPASGVLRRIAVPVGQTVPVKTVLAEIAGEDPISAADAPAGERQAQVDALAPQSTRPAAGAEPVRTSSSRSRTIASPRARMRARELGVSLEALRGSGPGGRIMEDDVLAAAKATLHRPAASSQHPAPLPASGHGLPIRPETTRLTRIRRVTAERMAASARSVARVTLFLEVDFSEAARFRAQLTPEFARLGVAKLPWDAIIAKASALALAEHPAITAQWIDGQSLRQPEGIHIGIAVALEPEGLVVPVLRNASTCSLRELAAGLLALTEKARANHLSPEDMQGGTFTISNLGGYGIDSFTPIINPPETAVLGVGRIAEKGVAIEHRVQVREMCTLSLSFDHRVVDGAPAAAFLSRLGQLLERPYALLEI